MASKKLKVTYQGNTYTLEFNRKSVQNLEGQGFRADELVSKPATMLPMLFKGAFIMHHRFLKTEVVDEIFENLSNKDQLIGKLAEMYNEPIESMLAEPGKDNAQGNAEWTME